MSEEWHKYMKILEGEDQELSRAMLEEVSITLIVFYFSLNSVVIAAFWLGLLLLPSMRKNFKIFKKYLAL